MQTTLSTRPGAAAFAVGNWRRPTVFYVLLPVSFGLLMGWYHAGAGAYLMKPASIAMWVANWCLAWWLSEFLLRGARGLLRPWTTRLSAALVLAALVNLACSVLYSPALLQAAAALTGVDLPPPTGMYKRDLLDPGYIWLLVQSGGPGLFIWVLLRLAFEETAVLEKQGPAGVQQALGPSHLVPPMSMEAPVSRRPRLAELAARSGVSLDTVQAIQAEDHYVRLHGADRSVLVLFRFSEAVQAMEGEAGARVHRSFWVRRASVRRIERAQGAVKLMLANGLVVPVSQSYRALVDHLIAQPIPADT